MGKDRRTHGRKKRKGETAKKTARGQQRKDAGTVRDDGAGARDVDDPQRHHR